MRRRRADRPSSRRSAYFLKLENAAGTELIGAPMAELFVMCPECGLSAKLTPGEPQIKDEAGLCKHRQNSMVCPILDVMCRAPPRLKSM